MTRVDLETEPVSLNVVEHDDGRVTFSDIPERILPALVETYGPEKIARAIAPSNVERAFVDTLAVRARAQPRFIQSLTSGAFDKKLPQVLAKSQGKTATYFMAAINLSDEAVLGKTGAIYLVCRKGCHACQYRDFDEYTLTARQLADRMLTFQDAQADNIQWVSPTAYHPLLIEALYLAARDGFRLPIVHKSEGEDSPEDLVMLDGLVDLYLPDIKFVRPVFADKVGLPASYAERMKVCIREMYRQVGPLVRRGPDTLLEGGGLLVRHLLLPGGVPEARAIFEFISGIDPKIAVHVMTGYEPLHAAKIKEGINRRVTSAEVNACAKAASWWELPSVLLR